MSSRLDEALFDSFRFNLSRQIVGEVRGREMLAMIKAMESGAGSISTTHAADAEAALRKLVTCAMEAGPHVTHDYATRAIADDHRPHRPAAAGDHPAGRTARRAGTGGSSEIIAVTPGERETGYADHPRLPRRPPATGRGRRTCCPTSTATWRGTASTCAGFYAEASEAAS